MIAIVARVADASPVMSWLAWILVVCSLVAITLRLLHYVAEKKAIRRSWRALIDQRIAERMAATGRTGLDPDRLRAEVEQMLRKEGILP